MTGTKEALNAGILLSTFIREDRRSEIKIVPAMLVHTQILGADF